MKKKDPYITWSIAYKQYVIEECESLQAQIEEHESTIVGLQKANQSWEREYKKLMQAYRELQAQAQTYKPENKPEPARPHYDNLSNIRAENGRFKGDNRQEKIYYWHKQGHSNKAIADHLGIKPESVKRSIQRYEKAHCMGASEWCT